MKVENKTIIITDPCYICKTDEDWDKCEYGDKMEMLEHITNMNHLILFMVIGLVLFMKVI